eukprot:3105516-Prymnesium_polylepis.1
MTPQPRQLRSYAVQLFTKKLYGYGLGGAPRAVTCASCGATSQVRSKLCSPLVVSLDTAVWPAVPRRLLSSVCDMPLVGASTFRGTQINIYTTTDQKGRLIVNAKDSSATVCCTLSIPKAEVATADVKARVQSKLEDKYPCSAAAPEHPPHDLGSSLTLEEHRGLFSEEAADVLMAGVEALADRDR